jgi:hypothetical protein
MAVFVTLVWVVMVLVAMLMIMQAAGLPVGG